MRNYSCQVRETRKSNLRFPSILFGLIISSLISLPVISQNVGINDSGNSPNSSAMLDIDANDKGVLFPRLTTIERDAINSPAVGLMIFNLDCGVLNYYFNNDWKEIGTPDLAGVAGPIAGSTTPVQNETGVSYSISPISNVTNYVWTVPSDASIVSGQGTPSIVVDFGVNDGDICVTVSNSCSTNPAECFSISLQSLLCPTTLSVGDIYGGGVIFKVDLGPNNCQFGKIVSMVDMNSGSPAQWGFTTTSTGATSTSDGAGNTATIVGFGAPGVTPFAAGLCDAYTDGVHNDWYLPAKDELTDLKTSKTVVNLVLSNNGGDQLSSDVYWSSSERSNKWATSIDFGTNSVNANKFNTYKVRAIWAF